MVCSVLPSVAVRVAVRIAACCSVLQCIVVCCRVSLFKFVMTDSTTDKYKRQRKGEAIKPVCVCEER